MAEANMNTENTTKAPKDKSCPYCGQAFTSSSLGRHLDLYIKEKNPKAPDGIHNVDEIRKIRGSITRRQPRGAARRDNSAPRGSHAGSKRSPDAESDAARSPSGMITEAQSAADFTKGLASFASRLETTGVINDIPDAGAGSGGPDTARKTEAHRAFNRHMMKSSLDVKQRVQDALDTARAAELALREIISSWRAAKQQVEVHTMPFDFDPLSLDFPALCLQCLEPPPTLFSSTQHPTSTSWSIAPPGEKQNGALLTYFQEEFRKWKVACSTATTAVMEELTYPPSQAAIFQENTRDSVHKAEKAAERLERQVTEHLASAFSVWEQLPPQRRQELWILELARSVGRKQKEVDKLKETQQSLKQENTNLKSQIDHLNRLQEPREFKIMNPMTWTMDGKMMQLAAEAGLSGRRVVGLSTEDRHSDINTVVSSAIDRWKSVILSSRATSGLNAQRPLDQYSAPAQTPTTTTHPPTPTVQQTNLHQQPFQHARQRSLLQQSSPPNTSNFTLSSVPRQSSMSSAVPTMTAASEAKTSTAGTPSPQSSTDSDQDVDADADADADADEDAEADEDEDAEADVEMEGEGEYLSASNTPTHPNLPQLPQHQHAQPHQPYVARTRDHQMSTVARQNSYPQSGSTGGNYGGQTRSILPSQQMHMGQPTFGHQHYMSQGHSGIDMSWDNH
ncbi:hypothetical protein VP1G_00307 [Cytospora mali]|uniref:Uncharacterized protein n=1 Tax=Cytospora mali TaxID=578113 RepID=A0A194UMN8_CYTMA|nr:hypothetical protein VP1G_00307 [Valsa mali var. pyri (nom. inval.)]